jgi:mannose-6-phosphate isomerase-like protein (cupin superfamily)
MKSKYGENKKFITKDGSVIRELMHPDAHIRAGFKVKNQSLAEATVPIGVATVLHAHTLTEELYHVTSGEGLMTLDKEQFEVIEGDTVCIPPGTPHCIKNTGDSDLKILCCCSPAYSDDDTQLLDQLGF